MASRYVAGCFGLLAGLLVPAAAHAQYVLHGPIDLTAMAPLPGPTVRTDEQAVVAPDGAQVMVAWLAERPGFNERTLIRQLGCDGAVTDPGDDLTSVIPSADSRLLAFGTAAGTAAWALDGFDTADRAWRLDVRFVPTPGAGTSPLYPLPQPALTDLELPSTIAGDTAGNATLWLAATGGDLSASGSRVKLLGLSSAAPGGLTTLLPGSPANFDGYVRARVGALPDGSGAAFALLSSTGVLTVIVPPLDRATEITMPLAVEDAGPAIAALGTAPPQYLVVTGATSGGVPGHAHCLAMAVPTGATTIDGAACPQPVFAVADVAAAGTGPRGDAWVGAVERGGSRVFLGAYGSAWSQESTGGAGTCVHPHIASSTTCTVVVASCGEDGARRTLAWIATSAVVAGPDGGVPDAGRGGDSGPGRDASQNNLDARMVDDGASDDGQDGEAGTDVSGDATSAADGARGPQFHGGACQCAAAPGAAHARWATLGGLLALGARRRRRSAAGRACR